VTPPSDDELVRRAVGGDDDACTLLVERHQDYVFSVAVVELGDAALAREVAQDVFVSTFQKLGGFRGEAAFTTWLYRVTLNRCRDVRRSQSRQRRFRPIDAAPLPPAPERDRPDVRLDDSTRAARVRLAVAALPDDLRRPVVLRYAGGLEYKAIAAALRLPLGTVCTRLQRAVRRLGRTLGKEHSS
jgi:RNA polymerase sigma-70 factor (ECF subfamily)